MNLAKILKAAHREMVEDDESRDVHALKRARERYGLFLNTQDLKQIAEKISRGDAVRLKTLSGSAASYLVKIGDQVCHVVYDPDRKRVATFLNLNQRGKRDNPRSAR